MQRFSLRITVAAGEQRTACDLVAAAAELAKARVKDAMAKGAVWLLRKKGGNKRLRRATTTLRPGDELELHYDPELLALTPPLAQCLLDQGHYSVWFKPAGLLAQGTPYGDHCSLVRQVEIAFQSKRQVLPVHRLDREVAGLMIVAHDRKAAAHLSQLLREDKIDKQYRVTVVGKLTPEKGAIDLELDGKPAATEYTVTGYDPAADTTIAEVTIHTGRLHQIRRHFELIGHPVVGDPRYGSGNKNRTGLQLVAFSLAFRCPFTGRPVQVRLAGEEGTL
ncbi:MAG: RluA family pseudouridine synthase [Desulfobulbaceae bacterium]|nr:RluA family pseudouridine synthase [Desulfobulbaceae bacterium]